MKFFSKALPLRCLTQVMTRHQVDRETGLEASFGCRFHQTWWAIDLHNGVILVHEATKDLDNVIWLLLLPERPVGTLVVKQAIQVLNNVILGGLGQSHLMLVELSIGEVVDEVLGELIQGQVGDTSPVAT